MIYSNGNGYRNSSSSNNSLSRAMLTKQDSVEIQGVVPTRRGVEITPLVLGLMLLVMTSAASARDCETDVSNEDNVRDCRYDKNQRSLNETYAATVSLVRSKDIKPSFDCAKASSAAEKAVCHSSELAGLDARIATEYHRLRSELDPMAFKALAKDQSWFVEVRDAIANGPEDGARISLVDEFKQRLRFLRAINARPVDGFLNHWRNEVGTIDITATADGRLNIEANAVEPTVARWVCEFEGSGKVADGVLDVRQVNDDGSDDNGSGLRLTRVGASLKVEFVPAAGSNSSTPEYCGVNGSVDGPYFAMPEGFDKAN